MLLLYLHVEKVVLDLLTDTEVLIAGVEASRFAMKMTQTSFWNRKVNVSVSSLILAR